MLKLRIVITTTLLSASVAQAVPLNCQQDQNTNELFCYYAKELRENGDLRSFPLFSGGPKEIVRTGYTAVFNCKVGYMELRDRRGVVFARNKPEKQYVKWMRNDVCFGEKNVKQDASLK